MVGIVPALLAAVSQKPRPDGGCDQVICSMSRSCRSCTRHCSSRRSGIKTFVRAVSRLQGEVRLQRDPSQGPEGERHTTGAEHAGERPLHVG